LRRFFERWPNIPGVVCTHFDGLVQETLRRLRQEVTVVHAVDQPLDLPQGDRVLVNLRGSVDCPDSLVLTKEAHDRLWGRVENTTQVLSDHLVTRHTGRGFLFLGVHPRDSLVRHFVRKLVENARPGSVGESYFVVTRPATPAEQG